MQCHQGHREFAWMDCQGLRDGQIRGQSRYCAPLEGCLTYLIYYSSTLHGCEWSQSYFIEGLRTEGAVCDTDCRTLWGKFVMWGWKKKQKNLTWLLIPHVTTVIVCLSEQCFLTISSPCVSNIHNNKIISRQLLCFVLVTFADTVSVIVEDNTAYLWQLSVRIG